MAADDSGLLAAATAAAAANAGLTQQRTAERAAQRLDGLEASLTAVPDYREVDR